MATSSYSGSVSPDQISWPWKVDTLPDPRALSAPICDCGDGRAIPPYICEARERLVDTLHREWLHPLQVSSVVEARFCEVHTSEHQTRELDPLKARSVKVCSAFKGCTP